MNRLSGKTALITGATSGIGAETARLFAKEGANVLVVGRSAQRGGAIVSDILKENPSSRTKFFACDVTAAEDIARLKRSITEEGFCIDILVNNAGIFKTFLLEDISPKDYDFVFKTNVGSAIFMTQAFIDMVAERGGNILNVASIGGLQSHIAGRTQYLYAPSKAALIEFSQLCAKNYADKIRVNCLCPGPNDTPIYDNKDFSRIISSIPMGRMGKPTDVANAALFLVSDEASYITGAILTVDGGSSI